MEFQLICPNDGQVDVGLQHITAVVFRGPELIEVVFECPHCGSPIRAGLRVENLLAAVMELARHAGEAAEVLGGSPFETPGAPESEGVRDAEAERRLELERAGEPYCEYFRRQLEGIESADDLLAEIEGGAER